MIGLLKHLHMSLFKGNKKDYDSNIARFYIWNINLGTLVPNLNSHWIYMKNCTLVWRVWSKYREIGFSKKNLAGENVHTS